jgi:hypothetical protein
MVYNTTFNGISIISWQSVLVAEETGVPETTTDLTNLSHNVVSSILRLSGIQTHNVNGDRQ